MGARNVELELVQYRTGEMVHTARQLICNFVQYSGIVKPDDGGKVIVAIAGIIRGQSDTECLWRTGGVNVKFSGFPKPVPKIVGGRVVFSSREPYFLLEENKGADLTPSMRTHVLRVTDAIAEEMRDVYKLRVEKDGPLVLVFPNQEYARNIEIFNAALLS